MRAKTRPVRQEKPLAWPGLENLRGTLVLSALFFFIFYGVYGACDWFAGRHSYRIQAAFSFEKDIPFHPGWAIIYSSLNLLFIMTPLIYRRVRDFWPLFLTLVCETLIAAVFFLLFPLAEIGPEASEQVSGLTGLQGLVYQFADSANLRFNLFPSLHVAFAYSLARAFGERSGFGGKVLFFLWATAIALSTLLIKAHYLLDVLAGAGLAAFAVFGLLPRFRRYEYYEALRIEGICLTEYREFVRRHRRYFLTCLLLYIPSLSFSRRKRRRARLMRATYALAQHVDDVLDLDRKIEGDPEEYARNLITLIGLAHNQVGKKYSAIEELTGYVARGLEELGRELTKRDRTPEERENRPRGDLIALFERLIIDHRRLKKRAQLNAEQLKEQHHLTFYYSLNILLMLRDSGFRAGDKPVPDLIQGFSWVSPVRDLREDLILGLINIPAEILQAAGGVGRDIENPKFPLESKEIRAWLRQEYLAGKQAIYRYRQSQKNPRDFIFPPEKDPGIRALNIFYHALKAYSRRYEKENKTWLL